MGLAILNTSDKIKYFLQENLKDKLEDEINAYISICNNYDRAGDIFSSNETTLLSLLQSALTRNEKSSNVWAVQQYPIYKPNFQLSGRVDLFAMYRKPDFNFDILIQAKRDRKFNPNIPDNAEEWEQKILNSMKQLKDCFAAGEKNILLPTYALTMFFVPLEKKDKEQFETYNQHYQQDAIDCAEYSFYISPKNSSQLLNIYGQIQKLKP